MDDGTVFKVTRLTNISTETAEAYLEMQRSAIGDRFRKTPEPYSSAPTPSIQCDDRFLPVYKEVADGLVITNMTASSTRSFPTCDQEAVTHHVSVRLLHCPAARSFVKVTTYTPVEQDEPSFSVSCTS